MKALSKENTPFVNQVTPADQNNNVQDEDNRGTNKEVNLDNLREQKIFCLNFLKIFLFVIHIECYTSVDLTDLVSPGWPGLVSFIKLEKCTLSPSTKVSAQTLTQSYTSLFTQGTPEHPCVTAHRSWRNLTTG